MMRKPANPAPAETVCRDGPYGDFEQIPDVNHLTGCAGFDDIM